jgi:AcrR family transcriptional regulator
MPKVAPGLRTVPLQTRAHHTLEALLDACETLLAEGRWAQVSTNRVAAAAGVGVGTLYRYFPHKEALLERLRQRHHADLWARSTACLDHIAADEADGRIDPWAELERIVRATLTPIQARPDLYAALVHVSLDPRTRPHPTSDPAAPGLEDAAMVDPWIGLYHTWMGRRRAFLRPLGPDGVPGLTDVGILARTAVAVLQASTYHAMNYERAFFVTEAFAQLQIGLISRFLLIDPPTRP